jgi:putative hydrolase of the HAD superfamily
MSLTHVFFDIGGVLGSNGWDRDQRARAIERFGLDDDFDRRHHEVVGEWETSRIGLDEYLDVTVFYRERPFTRDEFVQFMLAQSEPNPDTIALARHIADRRQVTMMTLNNEAAVLNVHRIARFGLRGIFTAFLSSCWLGVRKPAHVMFERALAIAQVADAGNALLVDDREQNLAPARAFGMRTILYESADGLRRDLEAAGLL